MSAGLVIIISCRPAMLYSTAGDTLHLNKASVNWTVRRYRWAVVVCDVLFICGWLKVPRSRRCPKLSPLVLDIFDFPAGRIGRLCAQHERGRAFLSPVRLVVRNVKQRLPMGDGDDSSVDSVCIVGVFGQ